MRLFSLSTRFFILTLLLLTGGVCGQEEWLPGDFNQNGQVDHLDFFQYALEFDPAGHRFEPTADNNADRRIDHQDFFMAILARLHGFDAFETVRPDQTGTVEGLVTEDSGLTDVFIPLANVEVIAINHRGFRLRTQTNEDGRFVLEGIPAGEITLWGIHPKYHSRRIQVAVVAGESVRALLELSPKRGDLHDLSGFVYTASGSSNTSRQPLPGAALRIIQIDDNSFVGDFDPTQQPGFPNPQQLAISDREGHYAFHDLPVGRYHLVVSCPGYQTVELDLFLDNNSQSTFQDFYLHPQEQTVATIEGTVFSVGQSLPVPLGGAQVLLEPVIAPAPHTMPQLGPNNNTRSPLAPVRRVITNADGKFFVEGLIPGEYLVRLWAREHQPATTTLQIATASRLVEDFYLNQWQFLSGSLAGVVSGSSPGWEDPVPLPDALVTLVPQLTPESTDPSQPAWLAPLRIRTTTTDWEGAYEFERVPAGDYLVISSAHGWGSISGAATIQPDSVTLLDLVIPYQPAPPPAQLSGRVWSATSTSGAFVPVGPAQVWAFPVCPNQPDLPFPVIRKEAGVPFDPDPPHPGGTMVLTDRSGYYRFDRLPAGCYHLVACANHFFPSSRMVELVPGANPPQDFELVPIPKPDVLISGRVFTMSPDGQAVPVPNALVRYRSDWGRPLPPPIVLESTDAIANPNRIIEAVSNPDGYFEFPPVIAGPCQLEIRADHYEPVFLNLQPESGEVVTLPVELFPRTQPPGGLLEGQVFQTSQTPHSGPPRPLAGAWVVAIPWQIPPAPEARSALNDAPFELPPVPFEQIDWITQTNPDGLFRFEQLPVGQWFVVVFQEGFLPSTQPVEIHPNTTTWCEIWLEPLPHFPVPGHLHGQVLTGPPDDTGIPPTPVSGAAISMFLLSPDSGSGVLGPADGVPVYHTVTDQNGFYAFPEIRPGDYRLEVQARDHHTLQDYIGMAPGQTQQHNFFLVPDSLESDARLMGHVFQVMPQLPTDDRWEGQLVPLEGVLVRLVPDDILIPMVYPPPSVGYDRTTDAAGYYEFPALPPGGYQVHFLKDGFQPVSDHIMLSAGATVKRDASLAPPPPSDGWIEGTVTEDVGFLEVWIPIPRATVECQLPDGQTFETHTDQHGSYAFWNLPSGDFHLTVFADGYQSQFRAGYLLPGMKAQEDFRLQPVATGTGSIHGMVYEFSGYDWFEDLRIPLAGAQITLWPAGIGLHEPRETTSASDGSFAFDSVPAGTFYILVTAEDFDPLELRGILADGDVLPINAVLRPTLVFPMEPQD